MKIYNPGNASLRAATLGYVAVAFQATFGIAVEWTLWWWGYLIIGAGVPLLWQWVRLRKRT